MCILAAGPEIDNGDPGSKVEPVSPAQRFGLFIGTRRGRLALVLPLFVCAGVLLLAGRIEAASLATKIANAGPIVRQMCGKSIALIGESPMHGFGKTLEFKVELVRRLIDQCHYNALFIESGIYDYLNIQKQLKSGHAVTDSMIAAAIGGLWANKEVQPLIPFLRQRVRSGSLFLGGLDDQLGRGTWAQKEMPSHMVAYLPGDQKARCLAILQRYMLWQYTPEAPYGPHDKALILGCLDSIQARLSQTNTTDAPWRDYDAAMIASLKRYFERDFQDVPAGMDEKTLWMNKRDRSMYQNFRWMLSQLPPHSKVIVWAATVHAAKELTAVAGFESRVPFGYYIHRDFKSRAFALGFSAYSGSYAFVGQPVRQLSPAPPTSLESQSFAGRDSDTVYLSRSQLRKIGSISARPLGTSFTTARWDNVLDGLVIFRHEQAPDYLKP
ncbi:MAG TPA: erythromycin esterase family protein [Terriglobia bacterium]|nr:erythromycin esterase family protein [Terriglobia bacterium]